MLGASLEASSIYVECVGLDDSPITGLELANVAVGGAGAATQTCAFCSGTADAASVDPPPCFVTA